MKCENCGEYTCCGINKELQSRVAELEREKASLCVALDTCKKHGSLQQQQQIQKFEREVESANEATNIAANEWKIQRQTVEQQQQQIQELEGWQEKVFEALYGCSFDGKRYKKSIELLDAPQVITNLRQTIERLEKALKNLKERTDMWALKTVLTDKDYGDIPVDILEAIENCNAALTHKPGGEK